MHDGKIKIFGGVTRLSLNIRFARNSSARVAYAYQLSDRREADCVTESKYKRTQLWRTDDDEDDNGDGGAYICIYSVGKALPSIPA